MLPLDVRAPAEQLLSTVREAQPAAVLWASRAAGGLPRLLALLAAAVCAG